MKQSYEQLFLQRGSAYDLAMQQYPSAREREFEQVIRAARLSAGMNVIDVPAGGAYLRQYLPAGCTWLGHEPCASFTNHGGVATSSKPLLPLPWKDGIADVAISLAGVHHIDDKQPLFREF